VSTSLLKRICLPASEYTLAFSSYRLPLMWKLRQYGAIQI